MNASVSTTAGTPGFAMPWPTARHHLAQALDVPRLCRDAALIATLLLVNKAGTPGAAAFFVILAIMVFHSPEAAFKAVAICFLGLMINQAFVPKTLAWTPSRLGLPYLALLRYSLDLSSLRLSIFSSRSYIAFLVFVVTMAICSIASGWYTHIALLKLVNFLVFITMLYAAIAVLRRRQSDLGEWFVALIFAATLFGAASVVLGVSSNYRAFVGSKGFNGAFLHPNAHATYASMFVAFLAIVWILSRYRRPWLTLPLLACWFTFIGWSSSRTAFIASLAGVALLFLYAKPARNRLGWRMLPNLSRGTLLGCGFAFAFALVIFNGATGGSIGKSIVSFINKNQSADGVLNTEQILKSRQGLVDYSLQNFRENPLFGIGFGVAKTEQFTLSATLFTAPVEKGFLPTAILEEGGVLGTTAFLVFIIAFLWELMSQRNVAGIVAFITFLVTNAGEVTIFAPGGGGAFGWTMVAAAVIFSDRCWAPPARSLHPLARMGYRRDLVGVTTVA